MIDSYRSLINNDYSHDYIDCVVAMKTVSKSALKARMLEYFRQVENTQEELIVTDHHRPVLRILPFKTNKLPTDIFGTQCKITYYEDINIPTSEEWSEI